VTSVPVAGSELHVERRGEGEPLLLIQGLGAGSAHWGEPFLDALGDGFELIAFDNRGIGRSGPCDDVTAATLAADALAVLDALELDGAHVVGFSMGGMAAQELALLAPERVRSLALLATSCGGTQSQATSGDVVNALTSAVFSGDRARVLKTAYALLVSSAFAADRANYAAFEAVARGHTPAIGVLLKQQAAVMTHDTFARLGAVSAPTLVVHGKEDQILGWINGDLVASRIPGARLELLEGVGHLLYWEQPGRVAGLVREHTAAHA
jgi:3-oxoadipate enol-lactonase